jgi:hypothetical protein
MANVAQEQLEAALAADAEAQRALMAGRRGGARRALRDAARHYRASWEAAGPAAYGRLIGLVKASILAGDASEAAAYVRAQIGPEGASPPAWYALGLAALVDDDDALAARAADGMAAGGEAFARAAAALGALAAGDGAAYRAALGAIVADFEARAEHLTGVAIADTALVLEALALPRGLAAHPSSPVLPPAGL